MLNLLSNAFKFTLQGRIAVELRAVDGHAELAVSDTGSGIPADELERVFERFHRTTTTRRAATRARASGSRSCASSLNSTAERCPREARSGRAPGSQCGCRSAARTFPPARSKTVLARSKTVTARRR